MNGKRVLCNCSVQAECGKCGKNHQTEFHEEFEKTRKKKDFTTKNYTRPATQGVHGDDQLNEAIKDP